jgi:hypothetical protein
MEKIIYYPARHSISQQVNHTFPLQQIFRRSRCNMQGPATVFALFFRRFAVQQTDCLDCSQKILPLHLNKTKIARAWFSFCWVHGSVVTTVGLGTNCIKSTFKSEKDNIWIPILKIGNFLQNYQARNHVRNAKGRYLLIPIKFRKCKHIRNKVH